MSSLINKFLNDYILCLKERTRNEKKGLVVGFDWIIYNLGLSKDWEPVRLPFIRQPKAETAKTKTEAEFGIDLCFLANDNKELFVYVLKDEVLNYQNWTRHNFDIDLRMASTPAPYLSSNMELLAINSVKVILAYNKDEDQNGIEAYERFVGTMPSTIGNNISLSFERWNITRIVSEVKEHLFSPDLLPQHLAGLFSYINAQVSDFSFGSKEWDNQLIPNWKNFLNLLFEGPLEEKKLRLVPISLLILYENKKDTPDSYPGWIDLIEWAMLSIWDKHRQTEDKNLRAIIIEIWHALYIAELERYLVENSAAFETEHGIHSRKRASIGLTPINDAYIAFWHLGRIGILNLALQQLIKTENVEEENILSAQISRTSDWLIKCLKFNPATMRPLLDLHHIELFLIWVILWKSGKKDEIYKWLSKLETYLLVRRSGQAYVPFIESRNRFDLVVEYAIFDKKPSDYTENSSYLLQVILELCLSLDDAQRDELLKRYFNRIVRGMGDDERSFAEFEIELTGWAPPENWSDRILEESVHDGVGIATGNFSDDEAHSLADKIKSYIDKSREKFPFKVPTDIPLAVYILACIKNHSPLPSEFWRMYIFPKDDTS